MKGTSKRGISVILAFLLIVSMLPAQVLAAATGAEGGISVWDGTIAPDFAGGVGSSDNPYRIETASQLAYLARSVNGGTSYSERFISLEVDLDMSDLPWTPIGTSSDSFAGTFAGGAHTISRLNVNLLSQDYVGLFGKISDGGNVSHLCLTDISVSGKEYVGGLAGYALSKSSNQQVISYCNVSGSVSGNKYVGGLVGYVNYIGYCTNNANITCAGDYAGGIAGHANGIMSVNMNTGDIYSNGRYIGGIVGGSGGSVENSIVHCFNIGCVGNNLSQCVGGIVGYFSYYSSRIRNCGNIGPVKSASSAGGIAGTLYAPHESTIAYCYNVGDIQGETLGSICGEVSNGRNYSYYSNNYTLAGLVSSSAKGHSGTSLEKLNTDDFLQMLNSSNPSVSWLRDDELYNGYPYIMPKGAISISITTSPRKSVYVEGERLDPTGMVVTASYNDGSKGSLLSREYSFYPNRELSTANNIVTVFCGELSASTPITVLESDASPYVLSDLKILSDAGMELSAIPANHFLASVTLVKYPITVNEDALVLFASYTSEGKYKGFAYVQVKSPENAEFEVVLPIDNRDGTIGIVKAFVIKSLENPVPLASAVSFPIRT